MRSSLVRAARAKHDDLCKMTWGKGTGMTYACTSTCAVAALGDGDTVKGIKAHGRACYVYCRKIDKRKQRMKRKKRRGWA